MSKLVEMGCMGSPVTLEVKDDGEVVIHGWDAEEELIALEMGFPPSDCFLIIHGYLEEAEDKPQDRQYILDSALYRHAARGELQPIRALIALGADPAFREYRAFREAAVADHRDVVDFFFDLLEDAPETAQIRYAMRHVRYATEKTRNARARERAAQWFAKQSGLL